MRRKTGITFHKKVVWFYTFDVSCPQIKELHSVFELNMRSQIQWYERPGWKMSEFAPWCSSVAELSEAFPFVLQTSRHSHSTWQKREAVVVCQLSLLVMSFLVLPGEKWFYLICQRPQVFMYVDIQELKNSRKWVTSFPPHYQASCYCDSEVLQWCKSIPGPPETITATVVLN